MNQEVAIKLIGGPLDGDVRIMKRPYESEIALPSPLRADIFYVYSFDDRKENSVFPLSFKFKGYLNR